MIDTGKVGGCRWLGRTCSICAAMMLMARLAFGVGALPTGDPAYVHAVPEPFVRI
jgi:hypothetical protein